MSSRFAPEPKTKTPVGVWIIIIILIILVIVIPIIVWVLKPSDALKKTPGQACTNTSECESTLTCTGNICTAPSIDGGFGDTCTDNTDCNNPLVCEEGICTQEGTFGSSCVADEDCNSPLTCVDTGELLCQCLGLSAPQNINVNGAGLGSITLTWDAVVGATGYIAYALNSGGSAQSPAGDETDDEVIVLGSGTLMHTFTGLGNSAWLNGAVRAIDDCGQGALSDFDSVFDP